MVRVDRWEKIDNEFSQAIENIMRVLPYQESEIRQKDITDFNNILKRVEKILKEKRDAAS